MTQTTESEKLGVKVATTQNTIEPTPTVPAAPRNGSRVRIVVLFVVLLLLVAGAVAVYLHYQNRVSSDDANVDGHITAIAPKISGNVLEVAVLDNQAVKTGQVLVRIDPRDYQARVDQAKAALLEAESKLNSARVTVPMVDETTLSVNTGATAQLADAEAEVVRARAAWQQSSTSDLAFAEANVTTRQASNDRAQADLARMRPLVDKAEISRQQFDAYTAAARVAASELQAAQQKLASAQQDATIRKAALDAAQTKVNQAQAQVATSLANRKQVDIRQADAGTAAASVGSYRASLEAAELMLSYTTIVSPIDGVVTRKSVEVGQIMQPGQGLMTVIPLQDTWVTANFKETQLADRKSVV